jgi:hypothetical protein
VNERSDGGHNTAQHLIVAQWTIKRRKTRYLRLAGKLCVTMAAVLAAWCGGDDCQLWARAEAPRLVECPCGMQRWKCVDRDVQSAYAGQGAGFSLSRHIPTFHHLLKHWTDCTTARDQEQDLIRGRDLRSAKIVKTAGLFESECPNTCYAISNHSVLGRVDIALFADT